MPIGLLFNFSQLTMVLSSSTRIGLSRISPNWSIIAGKLSRDSKEFDSFSERFLKYSYNSFFGEIYLRSLIF